MLQEVSGRREVGVAVEVVMVVEEADIVVLEVTEDELEEPQAA